MYTDFLHFRQSEHLTKTNNCHEDGLVLVSNFYINNTNQHQQKFIVFLIWILQNFNNYTRIDNSLKFHRTSNRIIFTLAVCSPQFNGNSNIFREPDRHTNTFHCCMSCPEISNRLTNSCSYTARCIYTNASSRNANTSSTH